MSLSDIALLIAAAVAPSVHSEAVDVVRAAEPITAERIAALPPEAQPEWHAYLERSKRLMEADKAALAAERMGGAVADPPGKNGPDEEMPLDNPADWYGSAEARQIADNIASFQTPAGGWGKNQDRDGPVRVRGQFWVPAEKLPAMAAGDIQSREENWRYVGTIDNGATTTELGFLALVQARFPGPEGERYRAAFLKGVRYLLDAQLPNGGWPQIYPLEGGYHDALTFNDGAVTAVTSLLQDVAGRKGDYAFVPAALASQAEAAAERAIAVMIATQVVADGKRTIWGQQHDALTLQPTGARSFEPRALATEESADLLLFLMRQPAPGPELIAAIDAGVAWLEAHALHDVEWARGPDGYRLAEKPGAGPLWARFYDIATGKPIFGDRDGRVHRDVNEISAERRNGYKWFGTAGLKVSKAHRAWRARLGNQPGE